MEEMSARLFPSAYQVTLRREDSHGYEFELQSRSRRAICPYCGTESARLHGFHERTARDLPILGKSVKLIIVHNRFSCDNSECETPVFTERSEFIGFHSQFTHRCSEYMLKVATYVSGEAAVRILKYQGIRVSGDTLLNMLKASAEIRESKPVTKIGVDDWAYRRGQKYGTLICDLETHEILDVLEGRDSETFEKWLRGHPEIEIVSRDRASSYASAVKKVLPDAVQIADRFHITKNLLEALNETMKSCLPEVIEVPVSTAAEPGTVETAQKKRQNAETADLAVKPPQ